jgi:hypothetical protein
MWHQPSSGRHRNSVPPILCRNFICQFANIQIYLEHCIQNLPGASRNTLLMHEAAREQSLYRLVRPVMAEYGLWFHLRVCVFDFQFPNWKS